MHIVSSTEARNNFKSILDEVADDADVVVIKRRSGADAVLMSQSYYEGLLQTVHLLKSPANAAYLKESIEEYTRGITVDKPLVHD